MKKERERQEASGLHEDEQSLIAASRKGDRDAYCKIVQRYQTRIYSLVFRLVADRAAAEDVTQDAFIRGFRNLHRFDPGRRFLPWMMRIAANLARNHLRSSRRRELPLLAEVPAGWGDPAVDLARREMLLGLERALLKLPVKYRLPLVLKHVEGLSYREMREVLRLPVAVLKMRVSRARARLRKLVEIPLGGEEKDS